MKTMNPDWLLKHFEQISEASEAVRYIWRFYLEHYDRVVPIPQMPSGKLVPKKSQMASGQSQDALPEPSIRIAQMASAQSVATFPLQKRLMEWASEAELQSKSGDKHDEP
ncbi:MAG: hypothetical protein EHM80_08720 [Nitrospiraceae bacterium]|nr:MAG: hypothetical protein EHM80_08720 [Nitrospiraceae bacterium]